MFKKIKVSVVIPVYNVEKYLKKCLDSVVNQTLQEIEIICINDGSTDYSLEILKKLAEKDQRVILINQKNLGPGSARAAGVKIAKGEYVGFVDADDYIKNECYEIAYNKATQHNADVLMFGTYYKRDSIKDKEWSIAHFGSQEEKIFTGSGPKALLDLDGVVVWNKIFKNKMLKENSINFKESMRRGEDPCFVYDVAPHASKVVFITDMLYFYSIKPSGIIRGSSEETHLDGLKNAIQELSIVAKHPNLSKYKNEVKIRMRRRLEKFSKRSLQDQEVREKFNEFKKYVETTLIPAIYNIT
ncbi:MAG: glycosyltransferase family 2 protein [Oscillospiraceae bacterium]|nr:glycosyltransferase family 2 protein [Oscillospiraceae bacterium]